MGTRYADEKIGEITDDEVIFKTGERFFLKEISKAVIVRLWFLYILCIVAIMNLNYWPYSEIISMYMDGGIKTWEFLLFVTPLLFIVFLLVKMPKQIIVLKAKNGKRMFFDVIIIKTDGKQFVEQLNRYIS